MTSNPISNKKNFSSGGFKPLADETLRLIDPILRKKLGLTVELLANWPEIVGSQLSQECQPLKIVWPRRRGANNKSKPATLVVVCKGLACLKIQHESYEIIQRLNMFFGFEAVEKIKIEQNNISELNDPYPLHASISPPVLKEEKRIWLENQSRKIREEIKDEGLSTCLLRLGHAIASHDVAR